MQTPQWWHLLISGALFRGWFRRILIGNVESSTSKIPPCLMIPWYSVYMFIPIYIWLFFLEWKLSLSNVWMELFLVYWRKDSLLCMQSLVIFICGTVNSKLYFELMIQRHARQWASIFWILWLLVKFSLVMTATLVNCAWYSVNVTNGKFCSGCVENVVQKMTLLLIFTCVILWCVNFSF